MPAQFELKSQKKERKKVIASSLSHFSLTESKLTQYHSSKTNTCTVHVSGYFSFLRYRSSLICGARFFRGVTIETIANPPYIPYCMCIHIDINQNFYERYLISTEMFYDQNVQPLLEDYANV